VKPKHSLNLYIIEDNNFQRYLNGFGSFNTNIFFDFYLAITGITCILIGLVFYDIRRKSKKRKPPVIRVVFF